MTAASRPDRQEAGRTLDAVIAERVMGWTDIEWRDKYYFRGDDYTLCQLWSSNDNLCGRHADETFAGERYVAKIPHYSTDLASAFLVVEKMRERAQSIEIKFRDGKLRSRTVKTTALGEKRPRDFQVSDEVHPAEPYWEVSIFGASTEHYGCWSGFWTARADTLPLAICLAALAASTPAKAAVDSSLGSLR